MKHQTIPLFITYDKHEDEFLNQDELKWYTRSNRKLSFPEVKKNLNMRKIM